ncbi:MAG: ABC transporter permease [Beijerinckiaceae bacterium]|uniref:ABC transporter permease n=1 Tax=Methylobacterium sp. TaxID=409 RepID=UPI0025EDDF34|nr:ABC transporter permease [Methylobacterium sp.]MBX9738652.1 ABC transporter permease [Beijerinckiaceae bacterium]MBX9934389.1 ABC transporter permease [Methylobacterium sp.]
MLSESLGILFSLWGWLVSVQREISAELAVMLRAFAETGDWSALAGFLPFGIAFGAAHALTPGHSKTVLSLFVAGSGASLSRGVGTAVILSATHIAISVLVVLLALPVVSLAFGEVGRARVLEDLSRGLIGMVVLWLLIAAIRGHAAHSHHEGAAFGVVAGLITCPLTLFVMTFASARGVPEAGLAFAFMMLIGVAAVLASVAALAVAARVGLGSALARLTPTLGWLARLTLGVTGAVLMLIAIMQLGRSY